MPDAQANALFKRYPKRVEVPALLLLTLGTLIAGLSLPFMSVDQMVFWEDRYTLFTSIISLWRDSHYILALIIFFFSIIFPFAKVTGLALLWYVPTAPDKRRRALKWIGLLGKWSMLDVFVIALLIVLTQSKTLLDATPRAGVYMFAGAILLSMVSSFWIEHLAKQAD